MNHYLKTSVLVVSFVVYYFFAFSQDKIINVLCYHKFTKGTETIAADTKKHDIFSISEERFEEHLKFLKESGYDVISMKQYLSYLAGTGSIPDNSVLITIDDGYRSLYDIAFPLLKKYEFPATIFIYSVFFGGKNNLNEDMIKEMMKFNFDVGSHSYTHPNLTKRNNFSSDEEYLSFLEKEIIKSKTFFESKLKMPVETFAYPYGLYSKEIIQIVKKAGYRAAFSVVTGMNVSDTPGYALHRTLIFNSTTVKSLKKILDKKPIKVKEVYPADGEIMEERNPEFHVLLAEDSNLNTATIKFQLNNKEIGKINYDSKIREIKCSREKPLSDGTYVATINAKSLNKEEYEYSWLFVIGKTSGIDLNAIQK
ncbi:MAG: polysaccharide deacetylase family protein [Candidatus Goldbacteria bacterium]|nr:polysaccharide deacetylase family protein [Candidatus Goldiibacteriota bacterium]